MNPTATATPFASPEEFFEQCDLYRLFDEWAADHRRQAAMISVGFHLDRHEKVKEHHLCILAGSRPLAEETRSTRRIRREIVQSFRSEGMCVRSDMVAVYWGQGRVRVHVGVLEPTSDLRANPQGRR